MDGYSHRGLDVIRPDDDGTGQRALRARRGRTNTFRMSAGVWAMYDVPPLARAMACRSDGAASPKPTMHIGRLARLVASIRWSSSA
jgi:hypothetical protein